MSISKNRQIEELKVALADAEDRAYAAEDARRFYRTEQGVVLVTREMLDKLAAEEAPGEASA